MTRRVHACLTCSGKTRHRGPCAACRRRGVTFVRDAALGPRVMVRLVADVSNIHAPTVAELEAAKDLTPMLAWHGTDCPCTTCARDRIPWRYA